VVPFLLALLSLAMLTSCTPVEPTPVVVPSAAPTIITCNAGGEGNIINCGTNNGNGGNGDQTAPGKQVVFGEKIAETGETCPSGVTPAEGPEIQRQTKVGCNSGVTCSPTDKSGNVIKDTSTNTFVELVKFEQIGSPAAGRFSQDDNAYNGHVFCSAPGSVTLSCSLRDTATGKVTSGGDGGTSPIAWTMTCVQ
jgi:hypothetical protein